MTFTDKFLESCLDVIGSIDRKSIENAVAALAEVRQRQGRVFVVGSGGGAGHASHATCDLRKLCNIEAYAPYDNISELTARVNDEGWDTTASNWLRTSRLSENDALLVFSVGGGNKEKKISMNLVNAMSLASDVGATIVAIVGRESGHAHNTADVLINIPTVNAELVTPIVEGFQAIIWHLLVSHPDLQVNQAKWESESLVERFDKIARSKNLNRETRVKGPAKT